MEEQRQRQDEEAKQAVDASKAEQSMVADSGNADEDALLRSALSMSVGGVSADHYKPISYPQLVSWRERTPYSI